MSKSEQAPESDNEEWPYAVTPASEEEQREFVRPDMKMKATNGNIYAGSRPRDMVEYAQSVPDQPRWIATTEKDNSEVALPYNLLFRHVFVGGLTGMGKSTLEKNIVQQHIYAGRGVCYIDPKGDDVLDILMSVPKERWDDVIFISPGNDAFDKQIGFNLLETHTDYGDPGFDAEVEGIVNDLKSLLAADDYWGPRMDGIASNMLRGMIRHEFDFTIADMFGALLDEESREEYANLIRASDENLSLIQGYTEKIAELDDTDLDAIRRRLKDWVEEPTMRQIIAQRDAEISIPDAVAEEKIILVNNNIPEEPKEAVATAILRQIWTAVDSRASQRDRLLQNIADADEGGVGDFNEEEVDEVIHNHEEEGGSLEADYTPYFLVIDEAHDVLGGATKVEKMLAKARSKRLGLTIASQQLRQLDQATQDAILGNCNTLISYDPGHPEEARLLSRRFGDKDDGDLLETDQFHAWMRTATGPGKRSKPFLAQAFAPYPPLHNIKNAYRVIRNSLDKYGTVPLSGEEVQDRMHFSTGDLGNDEIDGELTEQQEVQVSKAAYDEWLRRENDDTIDNDIEIKTVSDDDDDDDTEYRWIPVEKPSIRKRIDRYLPEIEINHTSELYHIIDHVSDNLLDIAEKSGDMFMRSTEHGKNKIFESGSASSAGGIKHRKLLKDGYKPLFHTGMVVAIPTQGEGNMPDGTGDLSDVTALDLTLEDSTYRDARNATDHFQKTYPLLDRLAVPDDATPLIMHRTQGHSVAIEAESSTGDSKPAQSLFNLSQAYNNGQRCLFTVREGVAKPLWNTLTEDGYYSNNWSGEHKRCYNGGELSINDQTIHRPAGAEETVWLYDDENDDFILADSDGERHARFESAAEVFERADKYPATDAVISDSQADNWVPVYRPFIPDYHFDTGISEDAWDIIIVPSGAEKPEHLQLYRGPNRDPIPLTEIISEEQTTSVSVDTREQTDDGGNSNPQSGTYTRASDETQSDELSDEQLGQMEETFVDDDDEDDTLFGRA